MSRGPKREPGLSSKAAEELIELACWISERAHTGKRVILSPSTAHVVAAQLSTAHAKPTRNEVALMICRQRCASPCYECTGRANIIVNAYGARLDDPRPKDSG
jgi:hypothetical protein